ncbi:PTS sugar transporter subunit IIA [Enterocloster asparagiformis]|uniref:PTS sugar transporter subunit IIA n=1 Tax=Enterocloster asparagiformis TaxID=333367 RepID=UPI00046430C5|nr:PTS sugar transporter subunit IIA [Enterocloster asparagiformis]
MSATVKGELIAADSVMCRVRAGSRDEVLKLAADHLKQAGYVTDGFFQALLERENMFPTGICFGDTCVAIPHAEPGFVKKPVMLIMTLERPVRFVNMEDCEAEIPVEIVFVLAFTDSEKHLNVLQRLSALIRDSGTAAALREAGNEGKLREVLRNSELAAFWRD